MSSSRRSESLNPRQRRRRRLNSSPDHHIDHLLLSGGHPLFDTARGNINQTAPRAIGAMASNSVGAGPSSRNRSRNDNLDTVIPLDQIVNTETIHSAPHQARPSFDHSSGGGGQSSEDTTDDSDTDTLLVDAPRVYVPGRNIDVSGSMLSSNRSRPNINVYARDRLVLPSGPYSQLNEVQRELLAKSEIKQFPEIPSVLLVYKLSPELDVQNLGKSSMPYLPFVPVLHTSKSNIKKQYMIEPTHQQLIDSASTTARTAQWVPSEFPVEMFDEITQHLSRDDIKSMRLVNKEFERGVSHSLFDTVVVPFNTELYAMIDQERSAKKRDFKGKRRADDPINNFVELEPGSLQWKNASDDKEGKVYQGHGIEVFKGFGSHIRRFGMSFEISENELRDSPSKTNLAQVESYFGSYDWPRSEYTRFEAMAGLEATADETSQMKLAFSHLTKVQQLALSMDSGLGWMTGPDRSLRSNVLQKSPRVFGCSHGKVDAQQQDRERLWETLENAHRRADTLEDLKEGHLERVDMNQNLFESRPLSETIYVNADLWSTMPINATASALDDWRADDLTGVLFVQTKNPDTRDHAAPDTNEEKHGKSIKDLARQGFVPSSLGYSQKEWLLEAEWAQRAFLNSYMLAVIDNTSVFDNISVLNLARISSRLVPLFLRADFWDALPKLKDVTLGVIPDWRTVERDDAGVVEAKDIDPSLAVDKAYTLLQDFIGPKASIKKLKFCWAAGGEHAEGIFARNNHILPAPITIMARSMTFLENDDRMINLPHVQELILSNCWISPIALEGLTNKLERGSLEKLVLDSVSLTASPRNTMAGHQQPAVGIHHAVGGGHGGGGQGGNIAATFGHQVWQGPPHGVAVDQWAQTMLQNLHWTLQQQGMALHHLPLTWTNHPMGMTMQQMVSVLAGLSTGVPMPVLAQAGVLFQTPGQQQVPLHATTGQPPVIQTLPPNFAQTNPAQHAAMQTQIGQLAQLQALPGNQQPNQNQPWHEGHRVGSWVNVIDQMSPGPRLDMYRPRDEFEPMPQRRKTKLFSIEFISCGYVSLRSPHFDQNAIEAPHPHHPSRYFSRRQALLTPAMLPSNDRSLGSIVQYMSEHEQDALRFAWGMRMGWLDEKLAEEPEYDGYLPGGTGRFSGVVSRDMALGAAAYVS